MRALALSLAAGQKRWGLRASINSVIWKTHFPNHNNLHITTSHWSDPSEPLSIYCNVAIYLMSQFRISFLAGTCMNPDYCQSTQWHFTKVVHMTVLLPIIQGNPPDCFGNMAVKPAGWIPQYLALIWNTTYHSTFRVARGQRPYPSICAMYVYLGTYVTMACCPPNLVACTIPFDIKYWYWQQVLHFQYSLTLKVNSQ